MSASMWCTQTDETASGARTQPSTRQNADARAVHGRRWAASPRTVAGVTASCDSTLGDAGLQPADLIEVAHRQHHSRRRGSDVRQPHTGGRTRTSCGTGGEGRRPVPDPALASELREPDECDDLDPHGHQQVHHTEHLPLVGDLPDERRPVPGRAWRSGGGTPRRRRRRSSRRAESARSSWLRPLRSARMHSSHRTLGVSLTNRRHRIRVGRASTGNGGGHPRRG